MTATAVQASTRGWLNNHNEVELERGNGAFSHGATENDLEEPDLPAMSPVTEDSAGATSTHHPKGCVQTHLRASLFHRKNKCHLYQMGNGFSAQT